MEGTTGGSGRAARLEEPPLTCWHFPLDMELGSLYPTSTTTKTTTTTLTTSTFTSTSGQTQTAG